MKNKKVQFLVHSAMIGSIYVVLTILFQPFSFGQIQVRIAEALTILPLFTPAAIPGLFVGCLIGNILGGSILPDIIFGSLATLIGAFITYAFRRYKWTAPIGPILSNAIIIPYVLLYAYGIQPLWFSFVTVTIGEIISCGILGMILLTTLEKYRGVLFKNGE